MVNHHLAFWKSWGPCAPVSFATGPSHSGCRVHPVFLPTNPRKSEMQQTRLVSQSSSLRTCLNTLVPYLSTSECLQFYTENSFIREQGGPGIRESRRSPVPLTVRSGNLSSFRAGQCEAGVSTVAPFNTGGGRLREGRGFRAQDLTGGRKGVRNVLGGCALIPGGRVLQRELQGLCWQIAPPPTHSVTFSLSWNPSGPGVFF